MLIPSSYAAPAPSPSASLSLESLSTLPLPSAESSSGAEAEASTGDRIFLSYGEWLEVLKQEADAIAISKPKKLAILAGDSISLWFPPDLLPGDRTWLNQGISGETSAGLLKRLSLFEATQPDTVFLMIGINDLIKGYSTDTVFANQELIIEDLLEQHPDTQIVIQSVLPHAGEAATWEGRDRLLKISNDDIRALNERLSGLSDRHDQVKYLDLFSDFADSDGNLRMELSTDGLHLNEKGYQLWRQVLQAYSLTAEHDLVENQ
ncbi:MAG: lysophospholipase [Synechococcales cyanobacterium T60_A2020_003]|nr:lysophospholipase [Synechococcales cyanobacterium T60_A2020_003]